MPESPRRYLFGPVHSRRLGISLGVDMVPPKTCTLNCVYCECGATSHLTTERREYYPAAEIIAELQEYLAQAPKLDYVTFGGSGEPTLNSALGAVIAFVKSAFPAYRTALLTNGTLLDLPDVRAAVMPFDVVMPSLDAATRETFARINGPVRGLEIGRIVQGLADFSREYRGTLLLEIFIAEGINDTAEEIAALKKAIARIHPARVQLNALDRPGTQAWVRPARRERLEQIAGMLAPLPVEIIARGQDLSPTSAAPPSDPESALLTALQRRPLTVEEACRMVSLPVSEARALLQELLRKGLIAHAEVGGTVFLCAAVRNA